MQLFQRLDQDVLLRMYSGGHRRRRARSETEAGDPSVVADQQELFRLSPPKYRRVTGFEYKPEQPQTSTVAAEIIVDDPSILVETLEQLHRELAAGSPEGDSALADFGDHLLPRLVERHHVVAHPLAGYWRDLGEPRKDAAAHRDLLLDDLGVLGDRDWPILTHLPPRVPARVLDGGSVVDSLLSPGCRIAGTVVRSVLGPGVVVEPGATVRDSVVFTDTLVQAGATVDWAVVDRHCTIESDSTVGAPADELGDGEGIVLVGLGSRVPAGAAVEPGARLEPGSTG